MGKHRLLWVWPLGVLALGLPQCKSSTSGDDDDAGESGQRAASGTGGGGTQGGSANAGRSGSGGSTNTSGAGGTTSCASSLAVRYADPPAADKATFDAMFPTAVCAVMKPCCSVKGTSYDDAACKTFAAAFYDQKLTYDPIEGARCLQGLGLMSPACDDDLGVRGLPGACTIAYRGSVALGAACDGIKDCAPDPRGEVDCSYTNSVAMDVCTVQIRGKVGDACDEGCELTSDDGACYPNDVPKKLGEWVTCHTEDGVRCTTSDVCEANVGLGCDCHASNDYCDGAHQCSEDTFKCVKRGVAGEPCFLNQSCTVDNYCPFDGDQVCKPRKHAGESCTENDECLGLFCQRGACNLENRDAMHDFDDAFCDGKGT
ncbi:MAG TPA: hypothetical protein VNN72_30095 [Polyangiaceae bacterium]|nr:hypothetical protein [Polyangiaceae bacterium]